MMRGQIAPLFAAFLVVLVALMGLVVDVPIFLRERQELQAAADSAALAGAQELDTEILASSRNEFRLSPTAAGVAFAYCASYANTTCSVDTNVELGIVHVHATRVVPTVFSRAVFGSLGEIEVAVDAYAELVDGY